MNSSLESCTCSACINLCRRNPGWMTPGEALKAMKAGLSDRLMLDWLEPSAKLGNNKRIYVLAPASQGCEGALAPEFTLLNILYGGSKGRCVFLSEEDRCLLHKTDYKPRECRETRACEGEHTSNYTIAKLWNTALGFRVVKTWKKGRTL